MRIGYPVFIILALLISCVPGHRVNLSADNPCAKAKQLRREAQREISDKRGILEAKAAALEDLCAQEREKEYKEIERLNKRRK